MMIVHRHLLLFGFLALLGGCATDTKFCAAPGYILRGNEGQCHDCTYELIGIGYDKVKNLVTGKVTREQAEKGNPAYAETEYTFPLCNDKVGDQIKINETNYFIQPAGSFCFYLLDKKPEVEEVKEY
jgi:hypothetical protein